MLSGGKGLAKSSSPVGSLVSVQHVGVTAGLLLTAKCQPPPAAAAQKDIQPPPKRCLDVVL